MAWPSKSRDKEIRKEKKGDYLIFILSKRTDWNLQRETNVERNM
jgi:hypothetical protein